MSFALTTPQILAQTKTVTRRIGWSFLQPGDLIQAVEKGQGLKKGEKVRKLSVIRVVDVRRERLDDMVSGSYTHCVSELRREGFPDMPPIGFLSMFCKANNCTPATRVTRIEFEYVEA